MKKKYIHLKMTNEKEISLNELKEKIEEVAYGYEFKENNEDIMIDILNNMLKGLTTGK